MFRLFSRGYMHCDREYPIWRMMLLHVAAASPLPRQQRAKKVAGASRVSARQLPRSCVEMHRLWAERFRDEVRGLLVGKSDVAASDALSIIIFIA